MKKILLFLFACACFSANAQKRIIGANNVVTILAGQAIPNWTLVRITGGKAYPANNLKIDSAAVAIAIDTAFAVNDTIQVAFGGLLQGFAVEKGKDYFLGTGGTLTATKPTSIYSQKVGTWVEDSTLQLNILQALPIQNTETFINLSSDVSNSTVTPSDVTGFSFTADANTSYAIRLYGIATFAAVSTGIGALIDAPNDATIVAGRVTNQVSSQGLSSMQQTQDAAIAGTNGTNGTGTSGSAIISTNTYIEGIWLVSVVTGGTVKMQFRSEIAASNVTIKAGSKMGYLKI